MKRDLYIDFAKGAATLSIVFIHTVFWSGQAYVPNEFRPLSLLFDVPLFFALSGLTSSANVDKTFSRLLKLQVTYMIFVTGLFLADWIFKVYALNIHGELWARDFYMTFGEKYVPKVISDTPDWIKLGNWYLHSYENADTFPVVMGSFWYLKVYYIVTVLGVLALRYFSEHIRWILAVCFALILMFNFVPSMYPGGQVGYVTYYLSVFLLASEIKKTGITPKYLPVMWGIIILSFVFLFGYYGKEIFYQMNKMKFAPKLPYIIWSFFSLGILFSFFKRVNITNDNFICSIGRNAIFYYFAQGVSSSLIYFIALPWIGEMPSWVLMILIFMINVILAIIFAKVFEKTDALGWSILRFLKTKTAKTLPSA